MIRSVLAWCRSGARHTRPGVAVAAGSGLVAISFLCGAASAGKQRPTRAGPPDEAPGEARLCTTL